MVPFFQLRNGHAEFLRNAGKRVAFHNMIGAVWRSAFCVAALLAVLFAALLLAVLLLALRFAVLLAILLAVLFPVLLAVLLVVAEELLIFRISPA